MKELILSIILFAVGLGFINGFNTGFQQLFISAICFIFLTLPLYLRVVEFIRSTKNTIKKSNYHNSHKRLLN